MSSSSDITNEIVKALTDPKPLYAAAGAGDLALERLREVPEKIAGITADPKATQDRISKGLSDAVGEVRGLLTGGIGAAATSVGRAAKPENLRALPERAQHLALRGAGRAAEAVAKANDAYEELAVRGRLVVERLRSSQGSESSDEDTTVTVEVVEPDESAAQDAPPTSRAPRGSATAKARAARAAAQAAAEQGEDTQPAREPRRRTAKPRTVKVDAAASKPDDAGASEASAPSAPSGAPEGGEQA